MAKDEQITIRYAGKNEPSAAELGLEKFKISEIGEQFTYGGRKPGPGEVYGAITVALVAAGAGVIGAAITGLCTYLSGRSAQKVSITGANGRSIEFPMHASQEQVKAMIKLAMAMDKPEIYLGSLDDLDRERLRIAANEEEERKRQSVQRDDSGGDQDWFP